MLANLIVILTVVAVVLYLGVALRQLISINRRVAVTRSAFFILGFVAVIIHAALLHWWIDIPTGQNLTFFNMLSLVVWLVSVFVLIAALRQPVEMLAIFIFPLAALSMLLVLLFPSYHVIDTARDPTQLVHILLSVITLSVMCLAGLQSILLAIQEYRLHTNPAKGIIHKLPPLETMESLLFQMIWIGFVLLSIVIALALYFYYQLMIQALLVKSALIMLAWGVFAVLLIGRYLAGWRGRKAIYYTLAGVILLIVAYFGSKLVLEFIL